MKGILNITKVRAWGVGLSGGWAVLAAAHFALGAEDPGARSLHRHQLQRQQQQESLQLRMHQQQRGVQNPSADVRQKHAVEQLRVNQQVQQQQLHYRQVIEPPAAQLADDEDTRRAKEQMERDKAQRQSQQQLQRFESQNKK